MRRTPRCRHCEEVIGVYEPLVVLADGRVRRTSRAAERDVGELVGEFYHDACYAQTHGEDATR